MKKSGLIFLCLIAAWLNPATPTSTSEAGQRQKLAGPLLQEIIRDKKESNLSKEEQIRLANEDFFKIYQLSQSTEPTSLGEKIALYCGIINKYPDAPLVQESYWHLIRMMLESYKPARKDDALYLYKAFRRNYPDSLFINAALDSLMKFLHRTGQWQDLLAVTMPYGDELNRDEKLKNPVPIFMYAEAKFHLTDTKEAARGYTAIAEQFPGSLMAGTARTRLQEIKKQ